MQVALGLAGGGGVVAALREAVEPRERREEIVGQRQLTLGVTDRQQAPDWMAADDHPVHIVAGAVHADVVQRCESVGSEQVHGAQVEYQLFGDAGMALNIAAQSAELTASISPMAATATRVAEGRRTAKAAPPHCSDSFSDTGSGR